MREKPFSEEKKHTFRKIHSPKKRSTHPGEAILQREEAHVQEKLSSNERNHTSGRCPSPKRRSTHTEEAVLQREEAHVRKKHTKGEKPFFMILVDTSQT